MELKGDISLARAEAINAQVSHYHLEDKVSPDGQAKIASQGLCEPPVEGIGAQVAHKRDNGPHGKIIYKWL